jgi:serine/threonine-protein kinase
VVDLAPTTMLGGYQVLRHLATGGMAEVLLARATTATGQHHVVIKRIRPDQAKDERFVQMFLDEARIAAMLQHPNIVRVYDIGEDRGEFFFAMEYVHGEDLRKVLMEIHKRRDQLPIALVTGVVAGAAAGLHHAHKQIGADREPLGIVHRDVSPANILLGYDGSVKVADFGIAKAALRTVETRSGTLKGKVSYMSPEQVTGKAIDRRSDVFALGVVLYECATARRLFKGDNDFLTMSAIVQGNIPLPSLYRPDLPRILEDIIMKALATAPADRFQSADELRAVLTQFTESLGMRMSPSSIADYMKKMFGARAEPWLVIDDEHTQTTSIDFDGSDSGLVQPPEAAISDNALPAVRPSPSSPLAFAHSTLTGTPIPAWTDSPSSGSAERMAWPSEPTPIVPRARRRMLGIALGAFAVGAIGIGLVLSINRSHEPKPEPTVIQMTATPPPEPPPVATAPPSAPVKQATPPAAPKPSVAKPAIATEPAKPIAPKLPPTVVVKTEKKPRPVRPAAPPATPKKPGSNWDPNALFAPK